MFENLPQCLLSGFMAGETFFLIVYTGYVGDFGDKGKAFTMTLQVALTAFVVFALIVFVLYRYDGIVGHDGLVEGYEFLGTKCFPI